MCVQHVQNGGTEGECVRLGAFGDEHRRIDRFPSERKRSMGRDLYGWRDDTGGVHMERDAIEIIFSLVMAAIITKLIFTDFE